MHGMQLALARKPSGSYRFPWFAPVPRPVRSGTRRMRQPSKTPRRQRTPRIAPEARRELLIEAAKACLSEKGLRGFTIQNVANEAQVSIGLVGHYFGGIDGLLQAVFQSIMFKMPPVESDEAASQDEAVAQLLRTVENNFAPEYYSRENLRIWLPLYQEMMLDRKLGRKLVTQEQQYITALAKQIAAVARFRRMTLDDMQLASDFIAFLDGLWLQWCFTGKADYGRNKATALAYLEFHLGPLRKT
jgi:TetR/AcrR family transcriptional repressor of bet genes